jgi:serine/threonine protein kinase
MTIASGTELGPYEILSAIGAGGMGEVYKARDTRLNRTVAIKVLPSHFSDNPEMKARFDREAQTIAGLNHPHICVLHDVGHQDSTDCLLMEYLEGQTLAQRLESWRRSLPLD